MNTIEWLEQQAPGFAELSVPEREAIMHFTLLWSRFEAGALHEHGNAEAIVDAASLWQAEGLITDQAFAPELAYFRNRYYGDGEFTYHFEHLKFRRPDRRELVEKVLGSEAVDLSEVAAAVLIIVFRLRNNYFHGAKWAYGIRGQLGNFTHANNALIQAIALHDSSSAAG